MTFSISIFSNLLHAFVPALNNHFFVIIIFISCMFRFISSHIITASSSFSEICPQFLLMQLVHFGDICISELALSSSLFSKSRVSSLESQFDLSSTK